MNCEPTHYLVMSGIAIAAAFVGVAGNVMEAGVWARGVIAASIWLFIYAGRLRGDYWRDRALRGEPKRCR